MNQQIESINQAESAKKLDIWKQKKFLSLSNAKNSIMGDESTVILVSPSDQEGNQVFLNQR
jgi:hypothetical protein